MLGMKSTEQLVDETMRSLDGIERAAANPYLYTRIEQRIRNNAGYLYQRKLMPVLVVSLVLFISLNLLSYLTVTGEMPGNAGKKQNGIEIFANEYNLSGDDGF
jgi:hypothetical protein